MQSLFKVLPPRRSTRECPDCAIPMASYLCGKATVESCLQCRGVWFDQRELGDFRAGLEGFNLEDLNLPPSDEDHAAKLTVNFCPLCRRQLDRGQYAYNSRVFVDRCEKCHGLWLPGSQVTRFIELVRVSKAIAQDVKALGREQAKIRMESENFELLTGATRKPLSTGKRITMFTHAGRGGLILPLRVDAELPGLPIANLALLALLFIFYVFAHDPLSFKVLGLVPSHLWNHGDWLPLFTNPFLHGNLLHLFFNLFYLWLFGNLLNLRMGTKRYLILFCVTAWVAGFAHALTYANSEIPAVGASGGISGVLGAFAVLFPRSGVHTLIYGSIFRIHVWHYIVIYIGSNLYIGFRQAMTGYGNIGWVAHLAGLVAGILLVHAFRLRKESP